jgi:5'-3' exonuclease
MCRSTFKDRRKVSVSADHDSSHFLNRSTLIYSPTLKAFVNKKTVQERYKISAENFCLVKSIAGDQSDNIPGVRGLSYKTIAKLVPETTSSQEITLDEFFEKAKVIQSLKNTKLTERLVCSETLVRRNWRLVRLDTNNLSLDHINKINTIFENEKGVKDKLGMLRYIMKLGINSLNIDGLYLSLQSLTR